MTTEIAKWDEELAKHAKKIAENERRARPHQLRVGTHDHRLGQVLRNLIDNARSFTSPGTTLEVQVRRRGDEVELRVDDHGPGIPPADQPHLFERFYRVQKDRNRDEGGTGLGLSISREICRLLGGEVTVESEPGKGSTFTL